MIATLQFNVPEETTEFYTAVNGRKYRDALGEIMLHTRNTKKYDNLPEDLQALVSSLYEHFHEIIMEHQIEVP